MASTRKTGKYGVLYLGLGTVDAAIKFAHTTNWRIETETVVHECTRYGESFARYMVGESNARVTAQGRVATQAQLVDFGDAHAGDAQSLVRVAWKLITLSDFGAAGSAFTGTSIGGGTVGYSLFYGYGWCTRSSLEAPFDGPLAEDFEIQVDGEWFRGVTT